MGDFSATLFFFLTVQFLGFLAWPLSNRLFGRLPDSGWAFSKILGIVSAVWVAWMASRLHLLPYTRTNSYICALLFGVVIWGFSFFRGGKAEIGRLVSMPKNALFVKSERNMYWVIGELMFCGLLFFWSDLRSSKPDLADLEKFMDYGFMMSCLRTEYFPPLDHFLGGETINYYYMGHLIAASLTQLSGVPPTMGYNIQMSNILALGAQMSFVLGAGLYLKKSGDHLSYAQKPSYIAGIVSSFLTMITGNLHYLIMGLFAERYWFSDATRFIPFTIHEYPIYSFVVNDLHGHVSDIPIVLLCIGFGFMIFETILERARSLRISHEPGVEPALFSGSAYGVAAIKAGVQDFVSKELILLIVFAGFTVGCCYVVSSWDFAIYLLLFGFTFWVAFRRVVDASLNHSDKKHFIHFRALVATGLASVLVLSVAIATWFPHWIDMKPPAQGIEWVSRGQRSPIWMMAIIWGLHLFFVAIYFLYQRDEEKRELELKELQTAKKKKPNAKELAQNLLPRSSWGFLEVMVLLACILILLPEMIYFKDIYPGHPRSNTMFKLCYQAWILLGVFGGVSFVLVWKNYERLRPSWTLTYKWLSIGLLIGGLLYPFKAVEQSIGAGRKERTLHGDAFMKDNMNADWKAVQWMNANILGQPLILEAVGESYTMYARVASFTGLPTVLGWPVHEWLWRGSVAYSLVPTSNLEKSTGVIDTVDKRRADVMRIYETTDLNEARNLLAKYGVRYVYVGKLEREKYRGIQEDKFKSIARRLVYDVDGVRIFEI